MQGAGIGYGVMKWSKNQKLAAAYVKFVSTGEERQDLLFGHRLPFPEHRGRRRRRDLPGPQDHPELPQGRPGARLPPDVLQRVRGRHEPAQRPALCDGELSMDQYIAEYQKLITK